MDWLIADSLLEVPVFWAANMSDGGAWSRYVNTPPPSLLLLTTLVNTAKRPGLCGRGKRVVMVTLIIHQDTI